MAPDPMALAATAMAAGVSCLCVTLGKRGAVYVAAPGFDADRRHSGARRNRHRSTRRLREPWRGAHRAVPAVAATCREHGDPTGCGDVWGATHFSRLLAGDKLDRRDDERHSRCRTQCRTSRSHRARESSSGGAARHVTTVINVPPSLDEQSFEQVIEQLAPLPPDAEGAVRRAPRALGVAVRAHGAAVRGAVAVRSVPTFTVPEHPDTASYWARTGFFRHAADAVRAARTCATPA